MLNLHNCINVMKYLDQLVRHNLFFVPYEWFIGSDFLTEFTKLQLLYKLCVDNGRTRALVGEWTSLY